MAYQYHSVNCVNNKEFFEANDLLDFSINSFGRELVANSVELVGKLLIYKADGTRLLFEDSYAVGFNPNVGAHSFWSSFNTSTLNQGSLENFGISYPRFVNMETITHNQTADYCNATKLSELRFPDLYMAKQSSIQPQSDGVQNADVDFCIKPRIIINRSNGNIPFSRTGDIRVSATLSTNNSALMGNSINDSAGDALINLTYRLYDVRMNFRTIPEQNKNQIILNKVIGIKTTMETTFANVSSNVPTQACNGVSISFQPLSKENTLADDNYKCFNPHLNNVEFLFNASNTYINYKLTDMSEIVNRGLLSMNNVGHSNTRNSDINVGRNLICGTEFSGLLDLTQSSFEIMFNSRIQETHNTYLYFHCLSSL